MISISDTTFLSGLRRRIASAMVVVAASLAVAVHADDYSDVRNLMDEGRLAEAGKRVRSLLRDNPGDPDLVFAQAVIAERSGDNARAMELYASLNRSHPELLEPYNNLAIHHARQGNYKAAVNVLEQALQANPSVATAYQNLSAIYAQLASAAYRKALNSSTPLEPLQLASLDQLVPLPGQNVEQTPALVASVENFVTNTLNNENAVPSGSEEIVLAAVEPEVVGRTGADNTNTPRATPTPEQAEPAPVAAERAAEPVTESAAAIPTAPEPGPGSTPEPAPETKSAITEKSPAADPEPVVVAAVTPSAEARQAVEAAAAQKQNLINRVKSWAAAWADRDVDRYLSHYSGDFVPRSGLALEEWKKQRYGRLRWRKFIEVKPSGFSVELDGDTAKVNFIQYYKSDRMEDTIAKTLVMKREGDRWLIVRELI